MVRNKDDASFVSWTETLHPESASSSLDPRILAAYNDTYSVLTEDTYPVAVHVIDVDKDQAHGSSSYQQSHSGSSASANDPRLTTNNGETSGDNNETSDQAQPKPLLPWRNSNLIDLILGGAFAISAFASTVHIEISSFIIYALAVGFHGLAERIFESPIMVLFKAIFGLVSAILMVVDATLLIVSVFVTEILAALALLFCTIFGGTQSGTEWHQFIRRICHHTRWAFRNWHHGWQPERVFPIPMDQPDAEHTALEESLNGQANHSDAAHSVDESIQSARGKTANDDLQTICVPTKDVSLVVQE